ncbi:RLA class II histocompatibility antigen, DP beta chain-like [Hirundo rustica]|uniref:RLA class II histocompatibility antigen, DP beta chain-like n=1 Tax=Hirundo rustica TaxID=43150 RepID=UPI001A93EB03|nr:RLA class II histocompatibility antigen, DP beta chain-like [Hirundo rustica]
MTPQVPASPTAPRAPQPDSPGAAESGLPRSSWLLWAAGGSPAPVSCTHRAVPGDAEVRLALHERHRAGEGRGQEQRQPGAAPALGQRCGAVGGGHLLWGEVARSWNSDPRWREYRRAAADRHCRHNYELSSPFLVERGVPPSVSISLLPSSSQPGPGRLLCSLMDFYPAHIQLSCFQGQQQLSGHGVAPPWSPTGTGASSSWCCWKPPRGAGSPPAASFNLCKKSS